MVCRLFAGGRWIRTSVPRVMDIDLGRQVPALIAVFELTRTAVTLQRGTKVIRPDRHTEFPRKIVQEFGGRGAFAMRLYGLQTGVADRNAGRFLTASASALPSRRWADCWRAGLRIAPNALVARRTRQENV